MGRETQVNEFDPIFADDSEELGRLFGSMLAAVHPPVIAALAQPRATERESDTVVRSGSLFLFSDK